MMMMMMMTICSVPFIYML